MPPVIITAVLTHIGPFTPPLFHFSSLHTPREWIDGDENPKVLILSSGDCEPRLAFSYRAARSLVVKRDSVAFDTFGCLVKDCDDSGCVFVVVE